MLQGVLLSSIGRAGGYGSVESSFRGRLSLQ